MGQESSRDEVKILGHVYSRGRVTGKGSYGKVYAVMHEKAETWKVVKQINKAEVILKVKEKEKENARDMEKLKRARAGYLVSERKILTLLSDIPFAGPTLYAATQDDHFLYLLMEYCSGGEMKYHVSQRIFNENEIPHILVHLTFGLEEIHKLGIIHRDIKSSNILFDAEGFAVIIDFNTSVTLQGPNPVDPNGKKKCVGTIPYTAPELIMGKTYCDKVDWWSLGCVLYELAHGYTPWPKPTQENIKANEDEWGALLAAQACPPKFAHQLSSEFVDLVSKLLELDPKTRYGAAQIKEHPFTRNIDWEGIKQKTVKPPFCPVKDEVHFSPEHVLDDVFGLDNSENINKKLTPEEQHLFDEWNWVNPKFNNGLTKLEEDLVYFNTSTPTQFPNGIKLFPKPQIKSPPQSTSPPPHHSHTPNSTTTTTNTTGTTTTITTGTTTTTTSKKSRSQTEDVSYKAGRIFFSLEEIPIQTPFLTERGSLVERISERELMVEKHKVQFSWSIW